MMFTRSFRWASATRTSAESARKAARRRAQIKALGHDEDRERVRPDNRSGEEGACSGPSAPTVNTRATHSDSGIRETIKIAHGPEREKIPQETSRRGARRGFDVFSSNELGKGTITIEANRSFQRVLLGEERESALQQEARVAVREAPTREAALEAFFLIARSSTSAVTAQMLQEVSTALVKHKAASELGTEVYAAALSDAVGSSDERWSEISPEESRAFALYQCTRLERYAERGHAFSEAAGMTLEGKDNDTAALIEFQLRRYAEQVAPVPTTALADLMHLDISWNAALRLYEMARSQRGVDPPVEMSNRLMGLMTGYRSNGIGSRPWMQALTLYKRVMDSGYETTLGTHALALDALWRSADSFHRQLAQRSVSDADRKRIWQQLVQIRENVAHAGLNNQIAGDEGCAYYESLIKAVSAAGKTDVAIRLLEEMDGETEDTSFRLLVPTPESYAFVMAACNAAGNAAHAEAVRLLFQRHYSLRDLHSEVLLVYLQSLRNVAHVNATIGAQLSQLLDAPARQAASAMVGKAKSFSALDRPCALACLQLLAIRSVRLPNHASKSDVAIQLYNSYDGSIWPQEPFARKIELQAVFRCCYLIALEQTSGSGKPVECTQLMTHVKERLQSVFGQHSPELEWLSDTEVYGLTAVKDVRETMDIFVRQVLQRPAERVKYLPIPLRQIREMTVAALVRNCRIAAGSTGAPHNDSEDDDNTFLFLDDDVQEEEKAKAKDLVEKALSFVETEVFCEQPAAAQPCAAIAELLLLQAQCTDVVDARRESGARAVRWLGLGDAASITPRLRTLVAQVLGLTHEYVESLLTDGHPQLRKAALVELSPSAPSVKCKGHPLERMYV